MKIHYQIHQPSSIVHDKPCLVLIHGLFGSLDNLAVIRRHFEQDYKVISIDLPDHGQSERSTQFSFDLYAEAILQCLTELKLRNIVLVGHSLGGKISMLVAHKIPQWIQQLVVMDIAPVKYSPRHQNVINGLSSLKLEQLSSRKEAQQRLADHVGDVGTQAFLLKSLYQNDQGQWDWRFNLDLIMRDYPLLSDWPYQGTLFDGPTLFIKGNQSDYILDEHRETITQQFPQATAKLVNAGHWLHAQKPQIVNALLTKYLPLATN